MKVTVNRQLTAGIYYVSFKVGEFSPDEVAKMQSFGVPNIPIKDGLPPPQQKTVLLPITQIGDKFRAEDCLRSVRRPASRSFAVRALWRLSLQSRRGLSIRTRGVDWKGVRLFVPQNNCGCIGHWLNSTGSV